MTTTTTSLPLTRRRLRALQRAVHLGAGVALLAEVYFSSLLGPGITVVVQWVVFPALVVSGLAVWKGPRIRRAVRRWTSNRA